MCLTALKPPDRQLRTLSTPPTAGAEVKIIELDLADQLAIGHLELVQMRTIPTRERRIHRISELAELVRPGRGENPTRPRPIILTMTTTRSTRIDSHVRAKTRNTASHYAILNCHKRTVRRTGPGHRAGQEARGNRRLRAEPIDLARTDERSKNPPPLLNIRKASDAVCPKPLRRINSGSQVFNEYSNAEALINPSTKVVFGPKSPRTRGPLLNKMMIPRSTTGHRTSSPPTSSVRVGAAGPRRRSSVPPRPERRSARPRSVEQEIGHGRPIRRMLMSMTGSRPSCHRLDMRPAPLLRAGPCIGK